MLWDHNAQTVVLLSKIDHEDFPVFWPPGQAKQTEGEDGVSANSSLSAGLELDCESFRVRFVEETVHQGHSTLDFVVSSAHDDYELAVRIIHCPEWRQSISSTSGIRSDDITSPAVDVDAALYDDEDETVARQTMSRLRDQDDETSAIEANLAVLKVVQDWHLEYQDGPLVVVDRYGGTEAATFCALTTLCKQLESCNSLDVYQVAKLYHLHRPGIWTSNEDLLYLYKAMATLIASKYMANPLQSLEGTNNEAVTSSLGNPAAATANLATVHCPNRESTVENGKRQAHSASASSSNLTETGMNNTNTACHNGNCQTSCLNGNGSASRRHSLPGTETAPLPGFEQAQGENGGLTFSSLPSETVVPVTVTAMNGLASAVKPNPPPATAATVNGGSGGNGFVLAIDTQDDLEDFEDLSETAALTQTIS